jgi:hypothetical protein
MVRKSTKPKTQAKAQKPFVVRLAKKPIVVSLKEDYTEQDLLDKIPAIYKKLKTAHRGSDTALIEFHSHIHSV